MKIRSNGPISLPPLRRLLGTAPEAPWPSASRPDSKRTARVTWFPVWVKNSARAIHMSPSGGDVFKATTSNHAKQATTAIRPTPDHANIAEGRRLRGLGHHAGTGSGLPV